MKKQKSGLYRTAVTVAGEKIWISAHTKAQLEEKRREVKQHMIYGTSIKPMTFHELVHKWYTDVREPRNLAASTQAKDKWIINNYILSGIESVQLASAVRRSDMQKCVTAMSNGHNAVQVSKLKSILQDVCIYGMELGVMKANHAHNIIISKDTQPASRRTAVPDHVFDQIMRAASERFKPTLAILYYCGLRSGEAVALTWADIDFTTNEISVTKSYNKVTHTISNTKTVNSVRTVHMPPQLVSILKPLRGTPAASVGCQNSGILTSDWIRALANSGHATLKPGADPTQYHQRSYICQYTPHQLRHSYATNLHAAGIDPVTASRLLGHASYRTTADIYTDIDEQTRTTSSDAIDAMFANHLHTAR